MKETDKTQSYFRFNSYGLASYALDSIKRVRRQVFEKFMLESGVNENMTVLDVGVSPQENDAANFFERLFPYKNNLTALGLGDYKELEQIYPGIKYVKGDGLKLPFGDKSFDWVFSHAVIEHVGERKKQFIFLQELSRVARIGFFVTTPNRAHPMEFHTGIPFLHYLPPSVHLKFYGIVGKNFYSSIDNLNLLHRSDLRKMTSQLVRDGDRACKIEISGVKWLGINSNTIVIGKFLK